MNSKQPWQMTKAEFIEGELKGLSGGERAIKRGMESTSIAATHQKLVKDAISEGKPVSAEVLKGYPELAKVAPVKSTTATKKGVTPSEAKTNITISVKSGKTKTIVGEYKSITRRAETLSQSLRQRGFTVEGGGTAGTVKVSGTKEQLAKLAEEQKIIGNKIYGLFNLETTKPTIPAQPTQQGVESTPSPTTSERYQVAWQKWIEGGYKKDKAPIPPEGLSGDKILALRGEAKQQIGRNLEVIHNSRPSQSRILDENRKHSITISPADKRVEHWKRDQGSADIIGIDTKVSRTPRSIPLSRGVPRITPRQRPISRPQRRIS